MVQQDAEWNAVVERSRAKAKGDYLSFPPLSQNYFGLEFGETAY